MSEYERLPPFLQVLGLFTVAEGENRRWLNQPGFAMLQSDDPSEAISL